MKKYNSAAWMAKIRKLRRRPRRRRRSVAKELPLTPRRRKFVPRRRMRRVPSSPTFGVQTPAVGKDFSAAEVARRLGYGPRTGLYLPSELGTGIPVLGRGLGFGNLISMP